MLVFFVRVTMGPIGLRCGKKETFMTWCSFAQASGASAVLKGTYWDEGDDVRCIAKVVRIVDSRYVGGAEAVLSRSALENRHLALRPQNFNRIVKDQKAYDIGEKQGQKVKLDVWTNKGKENLVFAEGDTMQVFVRVDRPCYIRMVYHLASGQKILLGEDSYLIEGGNVNTPIPLQQFVCRPPFGGEMLHVFASSEKFTPARVSEVDGYVILQEDMKEFLAVTRGMKVTTAGTFQAEASISLTTVPEL